MAEKKRALLVSKREKRESRVNYQTYVKQMYETSLPLRLLHLLFPLTAATCYLTAAFLHVKFFSSSFLCSHSTALLGLLFFFFFLLLKGALEYLLSCCRSEVTGSSLGSNSDRNTRWRSCAEGQQSSESPGTIGRSKGAAMASSHQQISVTIATEFVRWNEEAVSRCTLFSSQPAAIAANVRAVFTCLLNQVSIYITEGLERARDSLTEAAALRERFVVPSVSRRVAAAAASAVITLAFVQKQQLLLVKAVSDLSWFLCNVVGAVWLLCSNIFQTLYFGFYYLWMVRMLSCEEMAIAMSSAEGAAYKGLQQCIETVMAESCRIPFKGA